MSLTQILPFLHTAPVVWPAGSPDGGTLLHTAAMHGCYDIGMLLVVDFGLDPAEPAEAGMGMGGKTPYDLCVKAQADSEAAGEPELCNPDYWLQVMEEATEHKQNGGCVSPWCHHACSITRRSLSGVFSSRDVGDLHKRCLRNDQGSMSASRKRGLSSRVFVMMMRLLRRQRLTRTSVQPTREPQWMHA